MQLITHIIRDKIDNNIAETVNNYNHLSKEIYAYQFTICDDVYHNIFKFLI